MPDLEEITETPRTSINDDSHPEQERDLVRLNSMKRRSKKGRNSNEPQSPPHTPPSNQSFEERQKENRSGEPSVQQADSSKQDAIPTQEDYRAQFYENYRKVAEEYDKDFLKKHDEDLNTTLIFAGLFSAVTSAFIIEVNSQLQSDPNDETAALLRVLIYKIDNTTFGNNMPTLPQWTGPPRAIVQAQAILFASLAVSLFSAFLAMLGKQWLNRYESIDMRGSAIERSHSRQRKLDGIIVWYFHNVMESLPLMLQAGLLLLGCALSRYLWEINIIVASVILSITSLGAVFYLFILIAGTAFESCPYQTPGAHIFRYAILPTLHSAIPVVISSFSRLFQASAPCRVFISWWSLMSRPWYSTNNVIYTLKLFVFLIISPSYDVYRLGREILRPLAAFSRTVFRQLISRFGTGHPSFIYTSPRMLGLDHQAIVLDLRCISWVLQTSLDKVVHLSAFKHLASIPKLTHFQSTLVVDCFSIFIGCVGITGSKVVVAQGFEQLAIASANGFFRTLHYLATTDPTSSALVDLQRRYKDIFPSELDYTGLPFYSTMTKIHVLACRFGDPRDIRWPGRRLSTQEHIPFARHMVEAAREKYQQTQYTKVPRWILRSALYFLSLCPLCSTSVVADCLTVVAIDLGCDALNVTVSDESARVEFVSTLITQKLEAMIEAADANLIVLKRKAINTLLPYTIHLEQTGQQK